MAGFDISAATPVLKQYYTPAKVETLVFTSSTLAVMPKDTGGSGSSYEGAIRSAITSAVSATDTVAFTSTSSSIYKRWSCPWRSGYARALVSGEVLDKAGNDKGAFVKAVISETEGAYSAIGQQIGSFLFSNGGGALGQLDGGTAAGGTSDVTTTNVTLKNPSDAIKFRPGQVLKLATTDGTSGAVKAGSVTLTAVDIFTGVLTASGNWSAGIGTAANTDYLFADGDFGLAFQGIPAWLVANSKRAGNALSTLFNGVDRSTDPVRLAGVAFSGGGAPKKESLIQAGMMLHRLNGKPTHIIMNDLDFADIAKDLTTASRIVTETAYKNPQIGFSAIEYVAPFGAVKIMTDPFCPQGVAYILDIKTWKMPSMGSLPKVDFLDKLNWLRTAGSDSYEFRTLYRAATYCSLPGHNAVVEF
ncbi:hypothetical protein AKJ09_00041 [Labilithrix luteola]|uniref:Phage major capsid protein n=1 Tax=Labilithrix luteola TaxID=1391654 RepID=A0A0K1PIN5_9BACT|nr:DUF5309 family protein [Labilithrix luteola]AKU93377.1 hypothetical protein AKJ09_00041 [Labilithrix luteola]